MKTRLLRLAFILRPPAALSGFPPAVRRLLLALAACVALSGCFGFLKPAHTTARHFVLTPSPDNPGPARAGGLPVGVGTVKIPAYLFDTALAIRKGTNEIDYPAMLLWAERLDSGLQRVLASNLSSLLLTDRVRLSAWRSEDVACEVYVAVAQFDVDTRGEARLVAFWRILAPGGERLLRTGETRLARPGPQPELNPAGAVATLSDLAGELSRQIGQAIRETVGNAPPTVR
jgi:uncharacterized protein